MIQFSCSCGMALEAPEEFAGKVVLCPRCGGRAFVSQPQVCVSSFPRNQEIKPVSLHETELEERSLPSLERNAFSGKAAVSLALGFLTFLFVILAIPAVILGILGLVEIWKSKWKLKGKYLAISGTILALTFTYLDYLDYSKVWDRICGTNSNWYPSVLSRNNLKQIVLAMRNYHDVHKRLPPAVVYGPDGRPLYSWRVLLLPFLEQDEIYQQFHLDEPWDSPHNLQFLPKIPQIYASPVQDLNLNEGDTFYQVFDGQDLGKWAIAPPFRSSNRDGFQPFILETPQGKKLQLQCGKWDRATLTNESIPDPGQYFQHHFRG